MIILSIYRLSRNLGYNDLTGTLALTISQCSANIKKLEVMRPSISSTVEFVAWDSNLSYRIGKKAKGFF